MKHARPYPQLIVSRKAARSLAAGAVWVFEGEVLSCPQDLANGCLVDVVDEKNTWRGCGLYSAHSMLRVRIISRNANDTFDQDFWERRIRWAWEHRLRTMSGKSLPGCAPDTDAARVVFSEADDLPGLIVDRYADIAVAQVTTVGMEQRRELLYPIIQDVVGVRAIYERNDTPVRRKEGLELYKGWYTDTSNRWDIPASSHVTVEENGLHFEVDIEQSQKTGFFLDQKYNRRAVRELAGGLRVLDCFSHVGPFGLNAAAGGATFVRCVDISQLALDHAQYNAALNGLEDRMAYTCANVMDYLPQLARNKAALWEQGGPFDLIVLDPPAFTKSRSTRDHARRAYAQLNEAGLRLLPRGGYLATCSCSHFMTRDLLAEAIASAAHQANVQLKQVAELQQAPDHPIVWGIPETHYLDFFIFQVV